MPGSVFEIRYPNGDFEMAASRQLPRPVVGDTLRRKGQLWKVVSATHQEPWVLRVEPADDRRRSPRP
jgi:hypothetical protein